MGSGAAGGMAAHVLTSHGLKVLLLEAGKKLDIESELKSMEWPYDHPRRGDMPPESHALSLNEYNDPRPALRQGLAVREGLLVRAGLGRLRLQQEHRGRREGASVHRHATTPGCARACLGGKTNIWGRLALRLSDYDFKAKSHDGYGEDWPISYADIEPYYDRVDRYLGHLRRQGEPRPPARQHLPAAHAAERGRGASCASRSRRWAACSRRTAPASRPTGSKHNKYRSRCFGRGACNRRAGGCDIHAAFDSPTGLIYPAMDTGNLTLRTNAIVREVTVDPATGKARGVSFIDSETCRAYEARARVVVVAASTLESARLLLLSKSRAAPERHRQLQRPRRPQLLRARDGAGRAPAS